MIWIARRRPPGRPLKDDRASGQGLAWDEVARQLGGTAQARRMQLARAAERVARELGLDDGAAD